ncbi:hypothetical protein I302_103467 [Kwoniella bestiolae CBS 10118]|uniref:Uncharacterized protein n=1 Tax=Kwoniella bestiolae CBS 10118 TaxID=1296100 RepID=A0A1B9G8H4_9TREE|nr:hypothetical protein I302_02168 [Kwoniella bestiolae CBS 10118]OCF27327.1 hypothetical protein I302_02168 [Kwoniella bestiolae CBS 10118]
MASHPASSSGIPTDPPPSYDHAVSSDGSLGIWIGDHLSELHLSTDTSPGQYGMSGYPRQGGHVVTLGSLAPQSTHIQPVYSGPPRPDDRLYFEVEQEPNGRGSDVAVGYLHFLNSENQRIPFMSNPIFSQPISKESMDPSVNFALSKYPNARNVSEAMLWQPGFRFRQFFSGQAAYLHYPHAGDDRNRKVQVTVILQHKAYWDAPEDCKRKLYDKMVENDVISKFGGIQPTLVPPTCPDWSMTNQNMWKENDTSGRPKPDSQCTGVELKGEFSTRRPLEYKVFTPPWSSNARGFRMKLDTQSGGTYFASNDLTESEANRRAWKDLNELFGYPDGLVVEVHTKVIIQPAHHGNDELGGRIVSFRGEQDDLGYGLSTGSGASAFSSTGPISTNGLSPPSTTVDNSTGTVGSGSTIAKDENRRQAGTTSGRASKPSIRRGYWIRPRK